MEAVLQEQRQEWLIGNTSLYWHLKESLNLDGPRLLQDRMFVDSLASDNKLADGRSLFRWASDFAESTDTGINSTEAQQEILKNLLNTKLKSGSMLSRLGVALSAARRARRVNVTFSSTQILCGANYEPQTATHK